MEDKEKLVEQLKSAYRKFKTHTYYDNYGAINRAKLANFEFDELIGSNDDFFEKLANDLIDRTARKKLFKSYEIGVLCYPKSRNHSNSKSIKITTKINSDFKSIKITTKNNTKTNSDLGNIPEDSDEFDKLNYFIDLDIRSHILGTLWILRSGWILDHRLHTNCHGNRINKEVLLKIISDEEKGFKYSEKTPFLFEPYFKKYQVWRDEGLDSVQKLLDEKENALMLSLDFKEYYYTSTIDFKKLKEDIKNAKIKLVDKSFNEVNKFENELDEDLTDFIKDIFEKYTEYFERSNYDVNENKQLPLIPIGFLPSLIISNWNLQAFDQKVIDLVNPIYYGRYVDDILIVFKSHPESESFSKEKLDITTTELLEKYFIPNPSDPEHENNILKVINDKNNDKKYGVKNLCEKEFRYKRNDKDAKLNEFLSNYENLRIQSDKLKLFRFNHNNSKALIENFKKEIYRNSSEFRLMHTVEKLYANIGKNIFSIHYDDSINKISDIKSIKLNKFELSKTLSWLIRSSIYETNNSSTKEDIKNIRHAFSGSKKIEFMILWEKFIEFLFIEKKYETLEEEIEEILIKVSKLTFKRNKQSTYKFGDTEKDSEDLLKKSLIKFLYSTFARVISLRNRDKDHKNNINKLFEKALWNCKEDINEDMPKKLDSINKLFQKAFLENIDKDMPKKFILSYLYKNSLMRDPLFLINVPSIDLKNALFSEDNKCIFPNDLIEPDFSILDKYNESDPYHYYPRYIQFHETTLHKINIVIFNPKCSLDIDEYLTTSKNLYDLINGFEKEKSEEEKNIFYKDTCFDKNKCETDVKYNCKFINKDTKERNVNIIRTGREKRSKIRIGLINTHLNKELLQNALKGNPNRTSKRLDKIAAIINEAIRKNVELLVMPEMYIPYEWVPGILDISRTHNMAMVFGIEPVIHRNTVGKNNVGNYIAIALPSETENNHKNCTLILRLKNHYSPGELREYRKWELEVKKNYSNKYVLCIWNNIYFAPYYCYEIANIDDRSLFKSCCDMVIVSEYNKDTAYFTAIAESLSRDLCCYCIKVNSSEFGGTCILQPSKRETKYLINLKGGEEDYVVTHTLDINKLRNHQILDYESEIKDTELKPKPPGFNIDRVRKRMELDPQCNEDY